MTNRRHDLLLALTLLAAVAPAVADAQLKGGKHPPPPSDQTPAGNLFTVINNTSSDLRCTEARSGRVTIPAGSDWSRGRIGAEATTKFRCSSPADGLTYTIAVGLRYNWLRTRTGIHLLQVR